MFDDEQRYLFDLQGWITIPGALDAGQLAELNAEFDRRVAGGRRARREHPPVRRHPRLGSGLAEPDRQPAGRRHARGDPRRRVPAGPRLCGPDPPRQGPDRDAAPRRRDAVRRRPVLRRPRRPDPVRARRRRLQPPRRQPGRRRVRRRAGSHKANFALPEDWKELEVDPPRPWVTPVTGRPGPRSSSRRRCPTARCRGAAQASGGRSS